ncbi:MAG: hypothetical protein AAF389_18485 [Gemmatimonadota bacterium]
MGTRLQWLASVALVAITMGTDGRAVYAQQSTTPQDPSFLIGTWHVTETIYPGSEREYVEVTVRICSPELDGAYVVCRMQSAAEGRRRQSWFMVNQHDGPGSIEFVGIFTNVPYKTVYQGRFLDDGSGIDLLSHQLRPEGMTTGLPQTIRFLSEDEFEWRIAISNQGTPEESAIGIERAVRVSTDTGAH